MNNPIRRNRNIGTSKQGYGQNNCMSIPSSWHDMSIFYEKLRNPVRLIKTINEKDIIFLVEKPLSDYRHCCTVDDICRMLSCVPNKDWSGLDIVVLRQPTRKQNILSSVWGRLSYLYEYKDLSGVAIVLEAQPRDSVLTWSKSLAPDSQKEVERLSNDGHEIRFGKKCITINTELNACRNTQLFRTLPHEIGHYCHYIKINSDTKYQSIPRSEKEAAAHRYADELAASLRAKGKIPFTRMIDPADLTTSSLPIEWFE